MPKSVRGVMREFKSGVLHSGSSTGPRVTKPKQAIAIALSEQRQRPSVKLSSKAKAHVGGLPHPHRNLGKWLHKPK